MVDQALYTSNSDEWGTPHDLFDELDKEFDFTLDPCANPHRVLKQPLAIVSKKYDGLNWEWEDHRVFVNPPYSNIKEWCKKCYDERNNAELIVLLIPSRTDTRYFHDYIYNKAELRFIKGRLKFIDHNGIKLPNSAPFPSMLCIYRRK